MKPERKLEDIFSRTVAFNHKLYDLVLHKKKTAQQVLNYSVSIILELSRL